MLTSFCRSAFAQVDRRSMALYRLHFKWSFLRQAAESQEASSQQQQHHRAGVAAIGQVVQAAVRRVGLQATQQPSADRAFSIEAAICRCAARPRPYMMPGLSPCSRQQNFACRRHTRHAASRARLACGHRASPSKIVASLKKRPLAAVGPTRTGTRRRLPQSHHLRMRTFAILESQAFCHESPLPRAMHDALLSSASSHIAARVGRPPASQVSYHQPRLFPSVTHQPC